jgi:hypothetical protein
MKRVLKIPCYNPIVIDKTLYREKLSFLGEQK